MTTTEARNELEAKILEAQEGRITSDDLLQMLMGSQVFMPVQDEKAPVLNVQRSTRAQPLVLSAEEGTPILVLFSSPERAKPFLVNYPGFTGGILEPSNGCCRTWAAATASCSTRIRSRFRHGARDGAGPDPAARRQRNPALTSVSR